MFLVGEIERDPTDLGLSPATSAPDHPRPAPVHPAACVGGWLGEDSEGRPVPCLTCRPHLRAVVR